MTKKEEIYFKIIKKEQDIRHAVQSQQHHRLPPAEVKVLNRDHDLMRSIFCFR